jgi:hypothetical protein
MAPNCSIALRAIEGLNVSMESAASGQVPRNVSSAGTNRRHSSSSVAGVLFGRVEHAPISSMPAPASSASFAHAVITEGSICCSERINREPAKKLSGVTLPIAIICTFTVQKYKKKCKYAKKRAKNLRMSQNCCTFAG